MTSRRTALSPTASEPPVRHPLTQMAEPDQTRQTPEEAAPVGSTMLPERAQRSPVESAFVRLIATGGVVGIGVALGAILSSQNVSGWIIGLVVAIVSVSISAILWSSRRM